LREYILTTHALTLIFLFTSADSRNLLPAFLRTLAAMLQYYSISLHNQNRVWVNGTLPKARIVCETDSPPYSGVRWEDVLEVMGLGE
jgi:hypothetical protein